MDHDSVYQFVNRVVPGAFPHEADYSVPDELIRFATPVDTDARPDQGLVCATPSGVIEVSMPIDHRDGANGPVLPITEIAQLVTRFRSEVDSGAFGRIYGNSPARIDWLLNVSPVILSGDCQRTQWTDLDFPGRRPGGRAENMRPPADVQGYGRAASQSLAPSATLEAVARPLLVDLLERNGYRDIEGAVEDTIDSARSL